MRTPSLQRRAVRAGVIVVVALVLFLDAFVYVTVRADLLANLHEALSLRAELARDIATTTDDPQVLADGLARLGVPVRVTTADGTEVEVSPAVLRSRPGETLPISTVALPRVGQRLDVGGGTTVTVYASRAGTDAALRRLVAVTGAGTLLALLGAVVLLRRASALALEPLDHVVAAATRTAEGRTGERLLPDDPTTELGRLAVAYDHMLDELETALAEARASDERSRRFLADASHQLRTPMATIRAAVELLLTDPDVEQREQHLSHLVRETTRGARVLNTLLTLARLDQGRPLELHDTDLGRLVGDELDRTRSLGPHLAVSQHGELPDEPVEADPDLLREALANVLDNARRHAETSIQVTASVDDGQVELVVGDDGPGVPPVARNVIFERFASLDGRGGSGLGLPVARTIVEQHGGTLVASDEGFRLTLPRRPRPPAAAPAPSPHERTSADRRP